ncbi:MAG: hypothetical protein AAF226_08910, partial [Verrucomicrobiota bacterium]
LLPAEREEVSEFLRQCQGPIWAEATSGLRERFVDRLVTDEKRLKELDFEQVIRIGGVPSLRFWRDLEESDMPVVSFSRTGFSGLSIAAERGTGICCPIVKAEEGLIEMPGRESQALSDELIVSTFGVNTINSDSEAGKIRRLSELVPSEAMVFLGNSLPIREWNLAASLDPAHENCFANRGANGIDGELSTFFGLCQDFEQGWGVFGDLTTLYDMNAPWILKQIKDRKIRVVVINNGGGRIFDKLPAMGQVQDKALTENTHSLRFRSMAEMWGMEYVLWQDGEWAMPEGDVALIELVI